MWDDDYDQEEYERLTYDFDSAVDYTAKQKGKQIDFSSLTKKNSAPTSYYDTFYEDDFN